MQATPNELTQPQKRKAGAAQAWVLIFAAFLPIMAIIALVPAIPTLFQHFHDVPDLQVRVPLLITAPSLCVALLSPIAGALTDKFGRRKLLLTAMLCYGFGGILPLFIAKFEAIMVGRLVLGVAEAFIMTISNALIADYFEEKERHKWLTVQGWVGPGLAVLMLEGSGRLAAIGWQMPFAIYLLAFPILFFAVANIFEPEKSAPAPKSDGSVAPTTFPWAVAVVVYLVVFLVANIYWVYTLNSSRMLDEMGLKDPALVGRVSAIASLGVPVGAFVYRRVAEWNINRLLPFLLVFMGLGYVGIGLSRDYHYTIVASWIQQIGAGLTVPVLVAWSLSLFPEQHRGRGMGFWMTCFFITQTVNPYVMAWIRGATGSLLATSVVMGTVSLVVALLFAATKLLPSKAP